MTAAIGGALVCEAEQWRERLGQLTRELDDWQPLWSGHAFTDHVLSWESEHPALSRALRSLQLSHSLQLQADPEASDAWLAEWLPTDRWRSLVAVPAVPEQSRAITWPRGIERDVPGRKWLQVQSFLNALGPQPSSHLLDWCSGKAHLGRALAVRFPTTRIVALERDVALVAAARAQASRCGLALESTNCDVMEEGVHRHVDASTHVCALHACGPLHLRLFEVAMRSRAQALTCAPCCYHLAGEQGMRPLSLPGMASWPALTVRDLRTAVQETVTADAHVRRRRQRLQGWQLGFDALQRELRGIDTYLPLPQLPTSALRADFTDFCRTLAERVGVELPASTDFAAWERRGEQRFAEVSALDLVRQRFGRMIELLIVTDRLLHLHASGYAIALRRFCPREISPRNLLMLARRSAASG